MLWGCGSWGASYWGEGLAVGLQSIPIPGSPPQSLLLWSPNPAGVPADTLWQVWINGALYDVTSDTQLLVTLPEEGYFYFDVFGVPAANPQTDNSECITLPPADRLKLTWSMSSDWGTMDWGASWGNDDAVLYRIYWDEGAGTSPLVYLDQTPFKTYTTHRLENGTYVFRIDSVDAAGNQDTAIDTYSGTIARRPDPPSDFLITGFVAGTETFSATWTASPSSGVTSYEIYSNGGTGAIDYATAVATVAAPAFSASWVEAGASASTDWAHAIRATNGIGQEQGVEARHAFELGDSPLTVLGLQPATPINLTASAVSGGRLALTADYPAMSEAAIGVLLNFYGDGGTGTIDYTTPIGIAEIPAHPLNSGELIGTAYTTAAFTDGTTYKIAAKAEAADGRESAASDSVTAIADAVAPKDVHDVTVTPVFQSLLEGLT